MEAKGRWQAALGVATCTAWKCYSCHFFGVKVDPSFNPLIESHRPTLQRARVLRAGSFANVVLAYRLGCHFL